MSERSLSPAVYGIETEYSCMITLPGNIIREIVGSCHSVDSDLGLYVEPKSKGSSDLAMAGISDGLELMGIYSTSTGMLSNGGRFYIDPSGPEYATPETATAAEAVQRSFDGDAIVLGVFSHLQEQGLVESYQFNRRVVDHNRSSRGIHLNTTTKMRNREEPTYLVKNWIATLNVAKGAIFGSGGLLVDEKGHTAYHHSPRLSITTDHSANYSNYIKRPLVRYPFKADGSRLGRIETVTSDALNFAWPLRASLVATNALVWLIERGYGDRLPQLRDPVAAAHVVGRYGNKKHIIGIGRGGRDTAVKPLDIMRQICEAALTVNDAEKHLDKESVQVLPEVIDTADRLTSDIYAGANQVESVARLVAMQRKMDKGRLRLDSERMCRFDYAWDWLGGGMAETLRSKGVGWQGFGDSTKHFAASRKRRATPPQDTRARVRGGLIRRNKGANSSGWDQIEFVNDTRYVHPLSTQA